MEKNMSRGKGLKGALVYVFSTYTHQNVYLSSVHIHTYMYACIFMYMYVYKYVYMHMYMYM